MLTRRTFCLAAAFCLALPARGEEPLTAEDVLRRVEERLKALKDYECEVETDSRLGEKREVVRMRLWAKQPAMLRVKVLEGKERGSEICIGPSGKIKGRKGGIFKAFVLSLEPDDSRMKSLRGLPLTALEWSGSLKWLREKAAVPEAMLSLTSRPEATGPYEVVVVYREGERVLREAYRFDPDLWILTEGEIYENELLVDRVVFRNVRLNPGLEEQWFRF